MDGGHWGTYAYVISPRAAAELLASVYPAYAQVDTFIIDAARNLGLAVFMARTPLVSVDNSEGRDSRTQRWAPPELHIPRVFHVVSVGGAISGARRDVFAAWKAAHPSWEVMHWNDGNGEWRVNQAL